MPCLVFKDKLGRRIEVAIDKPRITVGRQAGNDVVIPFRSVSRQHCEFLVSAEGVRVQDIGSSNGSMVNGKPLEGSVLLRDRDQLQIGEEFRIRFYESSKYPSNSLSMDKTQSVVLFDQDVARKASSESDATGAASAPPAPLPVAAAGGRTLLAFLLGGFLGAVGTIAVVLALLAVGILRTGGQAP